MSLFKKKEPGPCEDCGKSTAAYRCPVCHWELCEACVQARANTLKKSESGPSLTLNIVSDGMVDTSLSQQIQSRVQEKMKAMREVVCRGGYVCIPCSSEKNRVIEFKNF